MANLTIRNLGDETVEILKSRAKDHNRSLEAELRQILTDAASPTAAVDLRDLAERIAAMTPDVEQTDSTKIIREFRDR
ncbi:MAG: plasmid stabilization protein [Rhodospirillales bacterium]